MPTPFLVQGNSVADDHAGKAAAEGAVDEQIALLGDWVLATGRPVADRLFQAAEDALEATPPGSVSRRARRSARPAQPSIAKLQGQGHTLVAVSLGRIA